MPKLQQDSSAKNTTSSSSTSSSDLLSPSKVYVRIRPMVFDGSGHDQDAPGVAKSLEGYTDNSITLQTQYMFSKGSNEYTFPTLVLKPQSTQQEVYDQVVPPLLQQVETSDAMLLAYGQTATGKTVTIFGFEPSLQRALEETTTATTDSPTTSMTNTIDPDWGILPRLTFELFERFANKPGKTVIALSAIEFYLAFVVDLLQDEENDNALLIDGDNKPAGYQRVVLESPSDIFGLISTIMARRSSRGTHMNQSNKDHAGSSRSHCALIFNILHQPAGEAKFRQTCFHVVDLAGAERPSKVGEGSDDPEANGAWAAYKLLKGEQISAQEEGLVINYTLFEFCKEVKLATGLHKANKPYRAPRQCGMPLTTYLGRCIDGRALLSMIVCISQAPQCGWETWFSMNYGTDLACLCTRITPAKSFDLSKALQRCKDLQTKAAQALAQHEKVHANSAAPNTRKWHGRKRIDLQEANERLRLLKILEQKK